MNRNSVKCLSVNKFFLVISILCIAITGVATDSVEVAAALRRLCKAAEKGNPKTPPRFVVRCLFCYHKNIANDPKLARWLIKAAEQGIAEAQYFLGEIYVNKSPAEAVKWLRKAAEQEYYPAQSELGSCYWRGLGVEQDDDEAVKWCRKAAEQGHPVAQGTIGYFYWKGLGVRKNFYEAIKWLSKSSEQGSEEASKILSGIVMEISRDILNKKEEYPANALENLCFAADRRNPMTPPGLVASCFFCETYGDQRSQWWLLKAAEQGIAEAQYILWLKFTEKKPGENLMWLRKAAEQGYVSAQALLGTKIDDDTEAVKWYRKAAEQGNPDGQLLLGSAYLSGKGIQKNPYEAAEWLSKAVEQDYVRSNMAIALLQKAVMEISQTLD